MNHSPLIFSVTLIASLSLLNIGSAWSAAEAQAKPVKAADIKAKTANAKTAKAKTYRSKAKKVKTTRKATALKLASADIPKPVPVAASAVTTNPYFANQPAAILPLAARSFVTNQVANKPVAVAPVVTPTLAVAPTLSTPAISASAALAPAVSAAVIAIPAESVSVKPASVAPIAAAPAPVSLPSLAPPIYSAPAPVAANAVKVSVAANQPWNMAPTGYRNPYLAYQQQPVAALDPVNLFSQFGNGLKISLPFLPQFGNSAPATNTPANTSQATASAPNSLSSMFSSLKMMLPLTGDANILPTIKKVYPTGEKPLVVINFKCPTEVIGITPPPMKLLHEALNFGFDGLNKTNLLSFNLQQVCS